MAFQSRGNDTMDIADYTTMKSITQRVLGGGPYPLLQCVVSSQLLGLWKRARGQRVLQGCTTRIRIRFTYPYLPQIVLS